MPTLRLLHKCKFQILRTINDNYLCKILDPFFLPMQQVDKGAIRFVLSGANIMCPGLTSPGAMMTEVPKDTIVVSIFKGKWSNANKCFWLWDKKTLNTVNCDAFEIVKSTDTTKIMYLIIICEYVN